MKKLISILLISISSITFARTYTVKALNSSDDGKSMVFIPTVLKIEKGDEVKFVPSDSGHNFISVYSSDSGPTWKSGDDEEITVKFDTEGSYIYECSNHSVMAMAGVIHVGDKEDAKAKSFLDKYKSKFIMNKARLDKAFK